jgi:hypothetical protein
MGSKDGVMLKQAGYVLFAFDPAPHPTTARTSGSVSALKMALKNTGLLKDLLAWEVKDLESSSEVIKPIAGQIIQIPAGEAVQVCYQRKMTRTADQTETVVFLQYEFLNNTDLHRFTFETYPEQVDKYTPIFEEIINSFKFLK